jgi:hypothetical protein
VDIPIPYSGETPRTGQSGPKVFPERRHAVAEHSRFVEARESGHVRGKLVLAIAT